MANTRSHGIWLTVSLLAFAACAEAGELTWRRRTLTADASRGYIGVVAVEQIEGGLPRGEVRCEGVRVRLEDDRGRWEMTADGQAVASGAVEGAAVRFHVKRTPRRLMVAVGDRWVWSGASGGVPAKPEIQVGAAEGTQVKTLRLVARQPVRWSDEFPDPVPNVGVWRPIQGRWVLSSLVYTEQSANPAELAACFDELDEVASRDRTRYASIGIGVQLDRHYPRVEGIAPGSPAHQAGIEVGDRIRSVDGAAVSRTSDAMARLGGVESETVKVVVEHDGKRRELALERAVVVWGKMRRLVPTPPAEQAETASIVAGHDFWTDYTFTCGAQVRGVGALGMIFAWQGPQDYHAFRWLSAEKVLEGTGRWQFVRVRDGREAVLAEKEGGFRANEFYELSVAVGGEAPGEVRAAASVDGVEVLRVSDAAIVPGKVGFWAAEPGVVSFDDVVVGQPEDRERVRGSTNPYHRKDPVMRAWADPVYSWQYTGLG
ncbi:MAG: PDZ domain-containing protein, partial [Planctomycetota bacterium]